jgi:AraC-like DNA-binding protein
MLILSNYLIWSIMTLFVKNMVCQRCIMAVQNELDRLGWEPRSVTMGEIELPREPAAEELDAIARALEPLGFALIDDRRSRLIEQIKAAAIRWVRDRDGQPERNFSDHLAGLLHYDYRHLSVLFSEVEGVTIEHYLIEQRIEYVKELLVYDELTLSEIAWKLGYSSVAHLSSQFKKVTGLTPSYFKEIKASRQRLPLDAVGKKK